jgi:hypothetical protein
LPSRQEDCRCSSNSRCAAAAVYQFGIAKRTFEVRIALPVLLLGAVELGIARVVTVVGVVLEIAEFRPQDSVNILGAVVDVDVLEESSSQNAHATKITRERERKP